MTITIACLQGDVDLVASNSFASHSTEMMRTLDLFGGGMIHVGERHHPSVVMEAIRWAENPDAFVFPPDPVPLMAMADDLGMDGLFRAGAECIYQRVREEGKMTETVSRMADSMSDPVRMRLLDHAEPASFQVLREIISPYNHQYLNQLQKLLPNSHFARSHRVQDAYDTYESILTVQKNLAAHMRDGMGHLDVRRRVDRTELFLDGRHAFTLGRITHTLIVWDLLRRPFALVAVCNNVIDAALGGRDWFFTLETDGHIYVRSITGEVSSSFPAGRADSISASDDCLLAFATVATPGDYLADSDSTPGLWRWSPERVRVDATFLKHLSMACLSPDGEFVVHCTANIIQTSPVDPCETRHRRVLEELDEEGSTDLGDVISLAISNDCTIVAAVYVCRVKLWWLRGDGEVKQQYFDLDQTYRETFGHVAFSPDGGFIALGSWEGHITLLETHQESFRVHSRFGYGGAILHLAWSCDGHALAVSSYSGAGFIDPWRASHTYDTVGRYVSRAKISGDLET